MITLNIGFGEFSSGASLELTTHYNDCRDFVNQIIQKNRGVEKKLSEYQMEDPVMVVANMDISFSSH